MLLVDRLKYLGPNRRMGGSAVESHLSFNTEDQTALEQVADGLRERLDEWLAGRGLSPTVESPVQERINEPCRAFCDCFNELTARLLQAGGHRSEFSAVLNGFHQGEFHCVVESEDVVTGDQAANLALDVLAGLVPGMDWPMDQDRESEDMADRLARFLDDSRKRVLPADALAIIEAAGRFDIPVIRLDREPYKGLSGDFRVRPNGMLMLGQCGHQHIVDGTIYLTRSQAALPLTGQVQTQRQFLAKLGAPVAPIRASDTPPQSLLVVNNKLICVLSPRNVSHPTWQTLEVKPHPTLERIACQIARAAQVAAARIGVTDGDIQAAPGSPGAVQGFVDCDPAPRLDDLLGGKSHLMREAAEGIVRWAFPEGAPSRIPTVAITGTNGKSTTSAMTARILQKDGRRPGLAHTHGVLIGGQRTEEGDLSGFAGHCRIFESREVDAGVLETARGGVIKFGYAFDWCDVAVCLNVADDHLGLQGIHTVEQMAEVKASVIERARHGVVLNADDPHCAAMAKAIQAQRLCMVSMLHDPPSLTQRFPRADATCTVEVREGEETLVLRVADSTELAVPVSRLPATFGGRARFNMENAMHAMAAARLLGASPAAIEAGLLSFRPGFETLPGRLNFSEGLPFQAVVDYVHNEHGLRKMLAFLRALEVSGRRIIAAGVSGDRNEAHAKNLMNLLAGEFDHYILKDYIDRRGREPMEMARLCRKFLLEAGVPESATTVIDDELEACRHGMRMARPGDLLFLQVGSKGLHHAWQIVADWDPGQAAAE